MRPIYLLSIMILCARSAQAQDQGAEAISLKIAQKMKDSLSLTATQKDSLYNINLLLHSRKAAAWQQYADSDSLQIVIQRIENTRDSLYRPILTSSQFDVYRVKKRNLVNNN